VIQTPKQQHYLCKLLGFDYEKKYKPGSSNCTADALSRQFDKGFLVALTVPHHEFVHKLKASYDSNAQLKQLYSNIFVDHTSHEGFSIIEGLLLYKGKIYIGDDTTFKSLLLEEYHSNPLGGHFGFHKTFQRLYENFHEPRIKKEVVAYVKSCITCQEMKASNHAPYGLLQPIPIPNGIWEDIALDFIVRLPPYKGHTTILVVDRFSKARHFGMFPSSYTAFMVAKLFANMVCKLHMSKSIISYKDVIFMSGFWQELFRLNGTKLKMSTTYHPQSDGQIEILNNLLQQYLWSFAHCKPTSWGQVSLMGRVVL